MNKNYFGLGFKKYFVGALIYLIILLNIGCNSLPKNINPGDVPGDDLGIVFGEFVIKGDASDLKDMEEKLYANPYENRSGKSGEFTFSNKFPVVAVFLKPGKYKMGQLVCKKTYYPGGFFTFSNMPVINVESQKINYIGTYIIDIKKDTDGQFSMSATLDKDAYERAYKNFQIQFPDLSKKYDFNYIVQPSFVWQAQDFKYH